VKAVVIDEFSNRKSGGGGGDDGIETFVAGVEPLVEDTGLEQRSREACEGESRIGFARHKPTSHEGDNGFGGDGRPTPLRGLGGLAERRAATNLLAYQGAGRDVLNVQRTKVIFPSLGEAGRLAEDQQLGGAAGRDEEKI
jgi:hypothetical protein